MVMIVTSQGRKGSAGNFRRDPKVNTKKEKEYIRIPLGGAVVGPYHARSIISFFAVKGNGVKGIVPIG